MTSPDVLATTHLKNQGHTSRRHTYTTRRNRNKNNALNLQTHIIIDIQSVIPYMSCNHLIIG